MTSPSLTRRMAAAVHNLLKQRERERETGLRGGAADYESWSRSRFGGLFDKYYINAPPTTQGADEPPSPDAPAKKSVTRTGGTWAVKYQTEGGFERDIRHWDVAPPPEYFAELARVSKKQIIWGGNYFDLPPTRCFIVWRKLNIPLEGFSMSPVEYAWTSLNLNAAMCEFFSSGGSGREERFHPTQKPVELYKWIFSRFAKPGDRILDTHLGSGSSRIAAYDLGLDFVGCELDPVYYKLEEERFARHSQQLNLFID